jgi:hypothetical protein
MASGTFTIDPGWTLSSVVLYAENPSGGQGGQAAAGAIVKNTWKLAEIDCLPSGTYNIYARLTLTSTSCPCQTMYVDTSTVSKAVD